MSVEQIISLGILGANAVVAIATGVLAWKTHALAVATRQSVETSNRLASTAQTQVDLTRQTLAVSIQAVLVHVPPGGECIEESVPIGDTMERTPIRTRGAVVVLSKEQLVWCSVPFQNVGWGVAFIESLGVRSGDMRALSVVADSWIVPPGEVTRVSCSVPKDNDALLRLMADILRGDFTVELVYTNGMGGDRLQTEARVAKNPGVLSQEASYYVHQVSLRWPGDSEPFAVSGRGTYSKVIHLTPD